MKFFMSCLLIFCLFIPLNQVSAEDKVKDWGFTTEVAPMKEWTITFEEPVTEAAFEYIDILDEQSNKKPMIKTIDPTNNRIILKPVEPYEEAQIYTLTIDSQLKSASGKKLKEGGEKKFYVPSTKESQLILNEEVKQVSDFDYAAISYENDEPIHEFIYTGAYEYTVGDLIIVNGIEDFPQGFAGKVVAMQQQGNQWEISMKSAPLEEVIEELAIHNEIYLTADHLQNVAVPGYDVEVRNVMDSSLNIMKGELKLSPKIQTDVKGYDAQVEFKYVLKDLKLNLDYEVNKFAKVKELRITISGEQSVEKVAKLGKIIDENEKILDRPNLNNKKNFKDFEYTLPKVPITLSLPGVGGYLETGIIFELAASGGAQFVTEEETTFEFGVLYKNDKFNEIVNNSTKTNAATVMGFGELDAKLGVFGAVGVQAFGIELVESTLKGGAYSTFGAYAGFQANTKACYAVEAGGYVSGGVSVLPQAETKFGVELEHKIPLLKPLECKELIAIQPKNSTISLKPGESKKININKSVMNLKNGVTSTTAINANKLDFLYDKAVVDLDEETGYIKLKSNTAASVPIEISYSEDGKTFKTSVVLQKVDDDVDIQKEITAKKTQLEKQGFKVQESQILASGRQLLAIKQNSDYSASPYSTFIEVHSYDEQKKMWTKVYDESFKSSFIFKKKPISIHGDKLEQHIIYNQLGSWQGEHLSYIVVGSKDGKTVTTLFDQELVGDLGSIEVDEKTFTVCNEGEGVQYSWNGSSFSKKSVTCQSTSISEDEMLVLHEELKSEKLLVALVNRREYLHSATI